MSKQIKIRDIYANTNAKAERNFNILVDVLSGFRPKETSKKYKLGLGRCEQISCDIVFSINLFYGKDPMYGKDAMHGGGIRDVRKDKEFLLPIANELLKESKSMAGDKVIVSFNENTNLNRS